MALSGKQKLWIGVGIALVLALVVASPFAWRTIKEQRARDLAEDAQAPLDTATPENNNHAAAWEKAKAAYALNPQDLEVARTLAGIVNLARPVEAPAMWESIYADSQEEADLLAWFDSVIRLADKTTLVQVSERLAADFPNSSESLFRQAQNAFRQGKPDDGIELAQQAAQATDASPEIQFAYVELSQRSDDAQVREAGIDWLRQMAERPDETGLKASRWLLQQPDISRDQLMAAAGNLAQHPMADREDLLTDIVLRRSQGQQSREALLQEVQSLFELENPAELVELGRWLNQQGRSADFLRLVDEATAIQRRDLFLVWVDSMALDSRWEDLQPLMERPSLPIDSFTRVLFRARVQQELGNERIRDLIWGQAVLAAKDDVGKLQFAYEYALKLGWDELAREVLERLANIPRAQRVAFEKLVEHDQEAQNAERLRDTLQRMANAYPEDLSVANDLAYVNLLLNENLEQANQTALRLQQEADRVYLAHRMTLALALYQDGQPSAALQLLFPLAIDWEDVRPGWRAVYAGILAANGHSFESKYIMEGVDLDDLLGPEREFLLQAQQ